MISDELRTEIRRLFYAEHWKIGTIATQLDVHRDTIRRAINANGFSWRGGVRQSALDPYVEFVAQTLKTYPKLTGTRVHEMIRARGYEGSVAQVRRRINQLGLRPTPRAEAFLRRTLLPGEEGQVDWGHFGRLQVGGATRPLYCFVVTLSWSRAFHVDFSLDQTMAAVVRGHVRALEHFGGSARKYLYDNMKTAVIERAGNAIRFHPRLLELAGHYHFGPVACRPGRGNEKGGVERRIRDLRAAFFAGRHFTDLDDLRRQFAHWRREVAYRRKCPADEQLTVSGALDKERAVLLPLPAHPVNTDDVRATVARKQPYVIYDTNRYSIPHQLVGVPVTISATDERLRVLHGDQVVADHRRSWERKQVVENPAHIEGLLARKRKAYAVSGRGRLLDAVPQAEALYAALAQRDERMSSQTHALLLLLDRYGPHALGEAIQTALEHGTPLAASVEHLLAQKRRQAGQLPPLPVRLPDRPGVNDLRTQNHKLEGYDDLAKYDEKS
jgi:transposase